VTLPLTASIYGICGAESFGPTQVRWRELNTGAIRQRWPVTGEMQSEPLLLQIPLLPSRFRLRGLRGQEQW
jgi:hypothetical protein